MSKSTLKMLPVLIVAITAICLTQPVCAGNINAVAPTLTLTEVSNTQLNWAWDATGGGFSGSITTGTADQWLNASISGPNLVFPVGGSIAVAGAWQEPEDPT